MKNIGSNQRWKKVSFFSFDQKLWRIRRIYYKTENAEYSKTVSRLAGNFSLLQEIVVPCIGLQNNTVCRQEEAIT
jgi:hypothetical protein